MKITFSTIVLTLITTVAFCQDINDQLYNAVSRMDSLAVKNLLNNKADVNFKKERGFLKISMLILAVQNNDINDVRLLIKHGAEVDWRDVWDTTALMYATSKGELNIVMELIKSGANVNAKNKDGESVLSAANESKNVKVIELIRSLINKN